MESYVAVGEVPEEPEERVQIAMITQETNTFELLKELLSHTRAIAERRYDREIDVAAHSKSCRRLLASLQKTTQSQAYGLLGGEELDDSKDKKVLACLLKELVQHTRQSCEVLGELLKETEAELTSLRLVQRQTQAYGRQG